jgi:hypothetical protein
MIIENTVLLYRLKDNTPITGSTRWLSHARPSVPNYTRT